MRRPVTMAQPEDSGHDAPAQDDLPLAVTHAAMNAAFDKQQAVPLSVSVAWLVRYREAWWVVYERGWLRITDTVTAEDLDQAAARLLQAESAATDDAGTSGAPQTHARHTSPDDRGRLLLRHSP
jgi:hypothetical protein